MSRLFTIACSGFIAASILGGHAFAASQLPAQVPSHKAFAQPPANGAACMSSRLVSHVSYPAVDPAQSLPCGHMLSTDTVLTVHHWDKT